MNNNNDKKSKVLGIPYGTAQNKLRKMVLFHLLKRYKENVCFQCGKPIETVDELSIEHKKPWLNESVDLYWDMNNIAFSHLHCNCGAAQVVLKKVGPEGTYWCSECKQFVSSALFGKFSNAPERSVRKVRRMCNPCRKSRGWERSSSK